MRRLGALTVIVAAVLLPAAASSYWIQHSYDSLSSPEQFRPTADGSKPGPGSPPAPVKVEILPLPHGWPDQVLEAMVESVEKWNYIEGSAMRVSVKAPGRLEPPDPDWYSRYMDDDGRNTIEFITEGWPWFWSKFAIAVTHVHLDPGGRLVEADVFCNAVNYKWTVIPVEGSYPYLADQKTVDVGSIITHEMGHVLALGHSQHAWSCMYGVVNAGDTRNRHLTSDDRQGILFLYPESLADLGPPSIWGIHRDTFSDGVCGLATSTVAGTFIVARNTYVNREPPTDPLPGPHELITDPPQAGDTTFPYCLFGSGFSLLYMSGMDLAQDGIELSTVEGATWVAPNFVKAEIENGSTGYPPLDPGSFDCLVWNSPAAGSLPQCLFVNPSGNNMPEAVIQPSATEANIKTWVTLDGSGSYDVDSGDSLTYQWHLESEPPGSAVLDSFTAEVTRLYVRDRGVQVVRLVVNDSKTDSIADQVIIKAYRAGSSGRDHAGPLGCRVAGAQGPGEAPDRRAGIYALAILTLPIVFAKLFRKIISSSLTR